MNLKAATTLLLLLFSSVSNAKIIDANQIGATGDLSHPDDNTTLTYVYNFPEYVPQSAPPGVIDSEGEVPTKYFGAPSMSTSGTFSGNTIRWTPSTNLEDMLDQKDDDIFGYYSLLLLSYDTPTREFSYKAKGWAPDGFVVFAFDKNKELIEQHLLFADYKKSTREVYFGYESNSLHYENQFKFTQDVSYILFGANDTSLYVHQFTTFLPESNLLVLCLIGLTVLLAKFRMRLLSR